MRMVDINPNIHGRERFSMKVRDYDKPEEETTWFYFRVNYGEIPAFIMFSHGRAFREPWLFFQMRSVFTDVLWVEDEIS